LNGELIGEKPALQPISTARNRSEPPGQLRVPSNSKKLSASFKNNLSVFSKRRGHTPPPTFHSFSPGRFFKLFILPAPGPSRQLLPTRRGGPKLTRGQNRGGRPSSLLSLHFCLLSLHVLFPFSSYFVGLPANKRTTAFAWCLWDRSTG
jgi:hypothetical protein